MSPRRVAHFPLNAAFFFSTKEKFIACTKPPFVQQSNSRRRVIHSFISITIFYILDFRFYTTHTKHKHLFSRKWKKQKMYTTTTMMVATCRNWKIFSTVSRVEDTFDDAANEKKNRKGDRKQSRTESARHGIVVINIGTKKRLIKSEEGLSLSPDRQLEIKAFRQHFLIFFVFP